MYSGFPIAQDKEENDSEDAEIVEAQNASVELKKAVNKLYKNALHGKDSITRAI